MDPVGAHTQGFLTATLTDRAGAQATSAGPLLSPTGGIRGGYRVERDHDTADGSAFTAVTLFQADNADHDTLSFKEVDFTDDIGTPPADTSDDRAGSAVIHDPMSLGDTVTLVGISTQKFRQYAAQDVAFHA